MKELILHDDDTNGHNSIALWPQEQVWEPALGALAVPATLVMITKNFSGDFLLTKEIATQMAEWLLEYEKEPE